jgi:hypothetical protein
MARYYSFSQWFRKCFYRIFGVQRSEWRSDFQRTGPNRADGVAMRTVRLQEATAPLCRRFEYRLRVREQRTDDQRNHAHQLRYTTHQPLCLIGCREKSTLFGRLLDCPYPNCRLG